MALAFAMALCLWFASAPAQADTVQPDISNMQLTRSDEGLLLSANLQFELPAQVEDAARQGIPIYFISEAQVQRERWYWSDQQLGTYEQLEDAMAAIQRISRWKILDAAQLSSNSGVFVQLRFRVDLSALPRPLQIGALGRSGWNLQLARTQVLEAAP
ncbi:MAG: DUF4390 domain-containing protein [Comamonas sp.]